MEIPVEPVRYQDSVLVCNPLDKLMFGVLNINGECIRYCDSTVCIMAASMKQVDWWNARRNDQVKVL